MIQKYITLDAHGQDMVDTVLTKEFDRSHQEDNTVKSNRKDNDEIYLVAAHPDDADNPEELEKMKRDTDRIKDME